MCNYYCFSDVNIFILPDFKEYCDKNETCTTMLPRFANLKIFICHTRTVFYFYYSKSTSKTIIDKDNFHFCEHL